MKFILEPLFIVRTVILGLVFILGLQTFNIQILNQDIYKLKAKNIASTSESIYAARGQIFDRNGLVLAKTYKYDYHVTTTDTITKEKDGKTELKIIHNTKMETKTKRVYVQGKFASQVIGKVNRENKGSGGIERTFDESLQGVNGANSGIKDVRGKVVSNHSKNVAKAEPGENLVLTIDVRMQEIVEKELKKGVLDFKASSASAVIVDPETGEILAMASYPSFDPNSSMTGTGRMAKNEIVSLSYEPGSTFKVITAAAALEYDAVDPKKIFPNEGKVWKWSNKSKAIGDSHEYGDMDMSEAMVQSSNIVFAKIAEEVGAENLYRMAIDFGFGSKTSANFTGEESGRILEPYELTRDDRTLKTMGFGHALMATPIQMVMAYAAIANGGKLMKPQIIKERRSANGTLIEKKEPVIVREVISESTAAQIREMLALVVNSGRGTASKVVSKKLDPILFGGKTGTAEKYDVKKGGYDKNSQIASFIGLAPIEDTRYVGMVLIDDPQGVHAGGNNAGPIFRRIMEGIYYHPSLSPVSYHLNSIALNENCLVDFKGLSVESAKELARNAGCSVAWRGEGNRVISQSVSSRENTQIELTLGETISNKMPDLKGLTLKDALELISSSRMNVEYTGTGRVVAQSPKADEELQKGMTCKLTLKENI